MSRLLKIAMISVHSCPIGRLGGRDTGGMNVYVRELSRELARRGHMVDIYTRSHDPPHEELVSLEKNCRLIHLDAGTNEEIPKIALYSYLQRFACGVESFRQANKLSYDLIHSHYWLSGLIGEQLRTWWHVPCMVMFHTLGAVKNAIGVGEEEPELRIESERQVVENCNRIIAAADKERGGLINCYSAPAEKIAVIPCGVDLDLFRPADKEAARSQLGLDHEKVILFVGRLEPLKGLGQLLRALPHVVDGQPPPRLIIVGGDEYSDGEVNALGKLARELHVEDRVAFLGSVDHERLPLFYSAADICVIPSYYESFGMVALESVACGTPIVATDVGGMRDIIRTSGLGYVVRDNSPLQLAGGVSAVLSQTVRQDAGARQSLADRFSWANIAGIMLKEYDSLLKDSEV